MTRRHDTPRHDVDIVPLGGPRGEDTSLTRLGAALLGVLVLLTLTAPAFAQDEAPGPPRTVIKSLRYVDAQEIDHILSILPIEYKIDSGSNSILIRALPGALDTAIAVIDNLDEPRAPSPSIEVVGYILAVSKTRATDQSLPEDLSGVVRQLRELFSYEGFHLLDTVFLRISHGSPGSVGGTLPGSGTGASRIDYNLGFNAGRILDFDRAGEKNQHNTLRFEGLVLRHAGWTAIQTDVEVREGQTAVIGKGRIGGIEQDLILVLRAQVLE